MRGSIPAGQRLGSNSQARRHIAKYAAVLLTAFICAGCTEASREPDISAEDSSLGSLPDGRTWLKLNAEITQTSKTEAAINETFPYEKGVFGLEYRIFNDNGLFEASCTGSMNNTVAMDVSVGWKTVVATANIARLMGVRFLTLKDLMEYTVENLDIFSDSNGVLKFMPMRSISRIYVGGIIAQRIASVQEADMIIVMDNGRISAVGKHEELLSSSSIYREVYEQQTRGGEKNE